MTDFQEIKELGSKVLKKINSKNEKVIKWKSWLNEYRFVPDNLDEPYAWLTVVLALKSVESGNYGVGSILVDIEGKVISMGHNLVYSPYFRSDLHGEMVAVNLFEKEHPEIITLEGYTLYTSLESCPMCLVRLISSGINSTLHVSPDPIAGMARNINFLPPLWKELSERQIFAKAACSEELTQAAMEVMLINAEELLEILKKRSAPLPQAPQKSSEGPFTVFAPTDEAFAALPEGALDSLLKDKEALTKVLTYHVASEEYMAEDVVEMKSITTLEGSLLQVNTTEGRVKDGDANITAKDIKESNGVIHAIDKVLIPPE